MFRWALSTSAILLAYSATVHLPLASSYMSDSSDFGGSSGTSLLIFSDLPRWRLAYSVVQELVPVDPFAPS